MGYPTSDAEPSLDAAATIQSFSTVEGSARKNLGFLVDHRVLGLWATTGAIARSWQLLGRETGVLGYPIADRSLGNAAGISFSSQQFEHGTVFTSSVGRGAALWGQLLSAYENTGGPAGSLGLPLGTQRISGATATASFQDGSLSAPA